MMTELPPLRSRVVLRPGMEMFYPGAEPRLTGTVKEHRTDAHGFEQIYVEWDRESQTDGWAFPAHFEVLDAATLTPENFAAEMIGEATPDGEECPDCGGVHTEDDRRALYLDILAEAAESAAESEAFAIFYVKRTQEGASLRISPFMISACLTDEGQALVEAQIMQVGQTCAESFMNEYLRKFT